MALKSVLLVLPALALADIDVIISGDVSQLYVNYTGKDVGVLTNTERNSFGVNDNDFLKKSVFSYLIQHVHTYKPGDPIRRADDVYLSSPTPYGDLHQKHHWREITRTLKPRNGKILAISSRPTVVSQQLFENNSNKSATIDASFTRIGLNTLNSTWWTNGLLSIEHEIDYKIEIKGEHGQMTYFNYLSVWNQNTQLTQPVKVGASTSMNFKLQPGQAVVAYLLATRVNIKIQVEYEANLQGKAAVHFVKPFRGYNFYSVDISDLMGCGGNINQLISREVIDIEFYSSSSVVVNNKGRFY